jgi:hypothetical protein
MTNQLVSGRVLWVATYCILHVCLFVYSLNASGPSQARRVSAFTGKFDFPYGFD